jgi:hypothetical protein
MIPLAKLKAAEMDKRLKEIEGRPRPKPRETM